MPFHITDRMGNMKANLKLIVFTLVLFLIVPSIVLSDNHDLNNTTVQVYFSPDGGCQQAIVKQISKAKSGILVQAYSFTSAPIAKALIEAFKRGVKVESILDKSQKNERYTSATFLSNARIPTYIDSRHAIAHNKIMIIDKEVVITGSFNFTKAAEEKNAENLLIIKSKDLAKVYIGNWKEHEAHSEVY